MERFEDYYSLLQVHPDAEKEIIQSAYKRLCRKYHPDVDGSPQATERMGRINAAYACLSDDSARRRYHAEWTRHNRDAAAAPRPSRVEVRERVVYVTREKEPDPVGGGTMGAYEAIRGYFTAIMNRDFRAAYATVSSADQHCFRYEAFMEWQSSVSALYEIGSFHLKLFKKTPSYKIGEDKALSAEEYTVTVYEKNRQTGRVTSYAITKCAVLENGVWKVYLGYQNLTPLLMQFKTEAKSQDEARLTGLWEKYRDEHELSTGLLNRRGFERKLVPEVYRNERYERPFSIAVFEVVVPDRVQVGGHAERILKYVGYIIDRTIRCIDSLGYLEAGRFGVLFSETDKGVAGQAARRVLRAVRHDIAACFDFEVEVRAGLVEYNGQNLDALIDGCLRTIAAASKAAAVRTG